MLALAMMRLESLPAQSDEAAELRSALNEALRDMRAIAAGLRLPELETLSVADAARRAVDDHVRRTGTAVELSIDDALIDPAPPTSLPTKIALFRALQELLSNSTRHGEGAGVKVRLETVADDQLRLTVSDSGPGFDGEQVGAPGHLGLVGIREQAELLGGTFQVGGADGAGARVSVTWPR
jgi:signal transduction histidine kinase